MKKLILFVISLLVFQIKINALEYKVELFGKDKIYYDQEFSMPHLKYTQLYIDIKNIQEIDSFEMYIKYENDLVGLSGSNLLNYITGSKSAILTSDGQLYYKYKYSNTYESLFEKYNFFTVSFMPKSTTPKSGTTVVEVYFKNAKDKNQNPVNIISGKKVYNFSKFQMILNNNKEEIVDDNKTEETERKANNEVQINSYEDKNQNEKSSNTNITKLEIKGYEIDFNKNTKNYDLIIDKDINKLDLNIELEDNKSTYKVMGNDNLKDNGYKVLVEVVAENGNKSTYTINLKIKEKNTFENVERQEKRLKQTNHKKQRIDKKHIIIGSIILCIIIITLIVIKIIINKKENKKFESLDNL